MEIVPQVLPSVSFSNVGGDRDRGAAQLAREPEALRRREIARKSIRHLHKLYRALPHDEVAIAPDRWGGGIRSHCSYQEWAAGISSQTLLSQTGAISRSPDTRHLGPMTGADGQPLDW